MIYRELLVMRKALMWYFICILALCLWMTYWVWGQSDPGSHSETDLNELAAPIAWSMSAFPAIFGVALGNGSREPARILWTLPVARWVLALRTVAVDLGATTVAFVGTFVLALLFFAVQGLHQPVELRGSIDVRSVTTALIFLFGVYGWSALAGMLGRRVAYLGIAAYPFLLVWSAFANSRGPIGELIRLPMFLNPVAVYARHNELRALGPIGVAVASLGPAWQILTLAAIFIITTATAIYLWQRAEVLN